ncbi:hypothetical protein [Polaromonas naphthalenivorans]|nr:hypothetical protein [Polaromonas naphthalenivorans]
MAKDWRLEDISELCDEEIRTLRTNAECRGGACVIALCNTVLASRGNSRSTRNRRPVATQNGHPEMNSNAVDLVADLFRGLPIAANMPNAVRRQQLQARPIETLGELWRLFVVCGFSSQENSSENGPLANFFRKDGPLLSLDRVIKDGSKLEWVLAQLVGFGLRFTPNKALLVTGNLPFFAQSGSSSTRLDSLSQSGGPLSLFGRLSLDGSLRDSDREIARSATFSAALQDVPFPQIGQKQLRNILVNGGLSRNVVPLDSRWMNFLRPAFKGGKIKVERSRYLVYEQLLRDALISVIEQRPDLENLAIVDAVVFSIKDQSSTDALRPTAWFGAAEVL